METLWQDIKFGARMLAKSPGFTTVAILTLALGIGANTAIFTVVNAALLRPLPFEQADRLAMVWEANAARKRATNVINPGNFLDWRDQNTLFAEMAAFLDTTANLTNVEDPEEIRVTLANVSFFSVLGAKPLLGRTFAAEDGREGQDNVVVIGHGFWLRRLGGDPAVIGKEIHLNGQPRTIIGVMPPAFKLHVRAGSFVSAPTELWIPNEFPEQARVRRGRAWMAVARLKPSVTMSQAHAEMETIGERLAQQYPDFNTDWTVNVVPLEKQLTGDIRPALLVLCGAVAFVLLIACANVANLLLARATAREREIALRVALGAGTGRVVRQLLTESLLLAITGGLFGLLVALWGVDALVGLAPQGLLPSEGLRLDSRVFGFALGASLLTGIFFGLLPAWMTSRVNLTAALKEGGRGATSGTHRTRARNVLVVAEVSLAVVLLVGAGLLIQSFAKLLSVDPGFQTQNLLTLRVQLPGSVYREDTRRIQFFRELTSRIRRLPSVRAVGMNSFAPFTGLASATSYSVVGRPMPEPGKFPVVDVRVADADFFRTMGIPLLRGRLFTEAEMTGAKHVVVVNEKLVREQFPDEDPIGKQLVINMSDDPPPTRIIGVVGDVKHHGLNLPVRGMSYWPHPELTYGGMHLVVRTDANPLTLVESIRGELKSLDANLPLASMRMMEDWIADSVSQSRFATLLLALFAGVALLLAAVGIYGVLAYSVGQRTHEIGVRMALGAVPGHIVQLVLAQGMRLAVIGVVIGLAAAAGLTRFLETMLFETRATDPLTFTGIAVLLLSVAIAACWIPARRATKVDPLVALRYE